MPSMQGEIANLIVQLSLDDSRFTGRVNAAAGALRRMGPGLTQAGRGVGQLGSGLARVGTVAATVAAGGLAAVVTTAVSFEDAFAGVRKTVDATEVELDSLQDTFRQMARTIPVSFEELSALGEIGGALGIGVDALDEFTRTAAILGETTDLASDQAATSLGVLSNILHLTEDDYDRFADVLVRLGNEGASTESAILGIAERAGAGSDLIGIAADETLAWSAAVANLGIEVEAGGTALQKFFLESLRNLQDDDTLEVMARTAGTTGAAFKRAFEDDASGALRSFVIGLGELEEAERLAVLEALGFSDIRITRALLGLAGNVEETENAFAQLELAEGAAMTEAERRFATTASQIEVFKNRVRDVAATIGAELLPVINELIKDFGEWLDDPAVQRGIKEFGENLARGIRDFAQAVKGADFGQMLSLFQGAAGIAKTAFDAFRSLPGPIQQLILAAVVANKVTGGGVSMIAQGIGNILAGTIRVAFAGALGGLNLGGGRVGGALNRILAQPVFVTNWPPGTLLPGGGGAAGPAAAAGRGGFSIVKFLGFATGAGFATFLGLELGKGIAGMLGIPSIEEAAAAPIAREAAAFDQVVLTGASAEDIRAIDDGIRTLTAESSQFGGIGNTLVADQLAVLIEQRTTLLNSLTMQERIALATNKTWNDVEKGNRDAAERLTMLAAKTSEVRNSTDRLAPLLPNTATIANNSRVLPQLPPIMQSVKGGIDSVRGGISLTTLAVNQSVGKLGIIAAKNFSPTVRVTTNPVVKISNTIIANGVAQVKSFTFGVGVGAPRPV